MCLGRTECLRLSSFKAKLKSSILDTFKGRCFLASFQGMVLDLLKKQQILSTVEKL